MFGCLLIFGVGCILIRIVSDFIKSKLTTHPYKLKSSLLSPNELGVYKRIKQILPLGTVLIPQVHYIEILDLKDRDKQKFTAKNKVDRKSIDFVIFDEEDLAPLLGIELDDRTHEWVDRIEKDNFENGVFNDVGLPLLRIRSSDTNNMENLKSLIQNKLSSLHVR